MFQGTDGGDPGKKKGALAWLQFSLGASFGPEQAKEDDFSLGPEKEGPRLGAGNDTGGPRRDRNG